MTWDTSAARFYVSVVAFFAADHIVIPPGGKMRVDGGFFDQIEFPVFPAKLEGLAVGVALEIPVHDTGLDHTIRIGVRDRDGTRLAAEANATFRSRSGPNVEYGEPILVTRMKVIENIEFPRPGIYQLVLWVDDVERKTYPIRAIWGL